MRRREVVQAADRQYRHRKLHRRLGIRSIERPRLGWVLIHLHLHLKCLLNVPYGPAHIHQRAIGMRASYLQAVGFGKGHHRRIILLGSDQIVP